MSTEETLGPIGQIAMTVADVARSVAFYRDTVGLRFLFSAGPTLAFFDCGSMRLMLSAPEGDFTAGSSTVLYFRTPDIEATYGQLGARGVSFVDKPHLVARMPDHELWM